MVVPVQTARQQPAQTPNVTHCSLLVAVEVCGLTIRGRPAVAVVAVEARA